MLNWIRSLLCSDIMDFNKTLQEQLNQTGKENSELVNQVNVLKTDLAKCEAKEGISPFESYLSSYPIIKLVYTKRWVLDKKMFPMPLDIRDFIKNFHSLPVVDSLQTIFKNKINYITDNFAYNNALDVWQFALETYVLCAGDCEDSAIYRTCLARRMGNKDVFCALGLWNNEGHCFNLWFDKGDIYILEPTSNKYEPLKIKTLEDTGLNYKINYIFNENQCWMIDGSMIFGAKIKEDFKLREGNDAVKD